MTNEIVYVRRLKDGQVLDIPKKDLEATLKRGFELVEDDIVQEAEQITSELLEPEVIVNNTNFICRFCVKTYKTQKALDKHIKTIHR